MSRKSSIDLDTYDSSIVQTKKDFLKLLKKDKPNLVIHITGIECDVSADPEVYSEEDVKYLNKYIQPMARSIWIDKTYVTFPGNRFKDAFMKEEGWYDLNRRLIRGCLKKSKKGDSETMTAIMTVVSYYLYDMIGRMGYDIEATNINFKDNIQFETEYFVDNRTEWRF